MSDNSYKTIKNGVIASVIAGVILLLIPASRDYAVNFLSWLWTGVVWCWEALVSSYLLPGWVLLFVFLFALIGLIAIYIGIKGDGKESEYKSYIEDFMHGAKWRWKWAGNKISNLWCFCPTCDATLVYDDSSCQNILVDEKGTNFICENCGHKTIATIKGGNKSFAIGAIEREIDRRIRNKSYNNR